MTIRECRDFVMNSGTASRRGAWAGYLAAQGFAAGLTDAFEFIPVVISRPVFTRLVFITAHATKIDAKRHMMANKPV